jgi:CheY-like chemotaxis protein
MEWVRERTHSILVVDDDPKAVEVIANFLPAPDYAVLRAYGGRDAVKMARQLKPDLILLDLMMPDMNGFEVVKQLQTDGETAAIPVLIVTAKQITAQDRAALGGVGGNVINIVEKAGFNSDLFVAEVRRSLQSSVESTSLG